MNPDNNTPNLPGIESLVKPFKFQSQPYEYKVMPLRECPTPMDLQLCDTPDRIADYWNRHISTHPHFNPECECCVVLMLNTRRRVKGHYFVSCGTQDTILIHPREVFRLTTSSAPSSRNHLRANNNRPGFTAGAFNQKTHQTDESDLSDQPGIKVAAQNDVFDLYFPLCRRCAMARGATF